jgi:N-acetylmuramoyl-L-alanine amidase
LAETFGEKLTKVPKLHTGVGQGPFWVLYGATMPSVLVETGFISNPREEKTLAQKKFHKELAVVICDAILEFKRKYERGL